MNPAQLVPKDQIYKKILQDRMQEIIEIDFRYPIIIWGTKTAAKICYRLLKSMKANIVAAGDNKNWRVGEMFYDLPLMTAEQISELYPDSLIVVGSFLNDVSTSIITQLKSVNEKFSFLRFEQIEYLYEIKYLNRNIKDTEKLFCIIHNIESNEAMKLLNKNVLTEYRYVLHDREALDLKSVLARIYGVKRLCLVADSDRIVSFIPLIDELLGCDKIGHIVIAMEGSNKFSKQNLKKLIGKVFYIICDERETVLINDVEETGFVVEGKKFPDDSFFDGEIKYQTEITEQIIVQSVLQFINNKNAEIDTLEYQPSYPVHIVQLFNGLANQMLMYLFGKFLEEQSGHRVIFDNTVLCLDVFDEAENIRRISKWNHAMEIEKIRRMVTETRRKNSYYHFKKAEVAEVFDVPIRLLSDYFDNATWCQYLAKVKEEVSYKYAQSFPLGQILLKAGMDIDVVRDHILPDEFFQVDNCFIADTYIMDMPYQQGSVTDFMVHKKKGTYYLGVWATGKHEDWLWHNRRWVCDSFHFRLDLDKRNLYYAEKISQSDGVVVHIRRGDFVYCNLAADTQFFRKSIQEVEKINIYNNKKYFVFSDDLEWCRENMQLLGLDKVENRVLFISGNTGKNAYLDLYLMGLGKICIPTPGSSFSYMAILMSKTMEKCIDIPYYLRNMNDKTKNCPIIIDLK